MVQDTNQMSREVLNKVTKQGQQWMGIEKMQKGLMGVYTMATRLWILYITLIKQHCGC